MKQMSHSAIKQSLGVPAHVSKCLLCAHNVMNSVKGWGKLTSGNPSWEHLSTLCSCNCRHLKGSWVFDSPIYQAESAAFHWVQGWCQGKEWDHLTFQKYEKNCFLNIIALIRLETLKGRYIIARNSLSQFSSPLEDSGHQRLVFLEGGLVCAAPIQAKEYESVPFI